LKEIAVYADVVVGINGLPGDRDAVALAKTLSRAGARLTLVNVHIVNVVPTKDPTERLRSPKASCPTSCYSVSARLSPTTPQSSAFRPRVSAADCTRWLKTMMPI
jgi:hypothetical protein